MALAPHTQIVTDLVKGLVDDNEITGAEIGVFRGRTAHHLLNSIPELEMLHCVDAWDGSVYADRTCDLRHADYTLAYQKALGRLQCFPGRYKIHRKRSRDVAPVFDEETLDFVFVDADHSHIAVLEDCTLWFSKVRPGGLFVAHDYGGKYIGATEAYDLFTRSRGLKLTEHGRGVITIGWDDGPEQV